MQQKEEPSVWSRVKNMTHEEVLLPSSLTKPYIEVQIQNDLTLWRVQALGETQNSQLQFPALTAI